MTFEQFVKNHFHNFRKNQINLLHLQNLFFFVHINKYFIFIEKTKLSFYRLKNNFSLILKINEWTIL